VANRSGKRDIRQFQASHDAAEHQAAATHVATSDEMHREHQPVAKNGQQQIDVFARRNAPEQHDLAVGPDGVQQRPRAAFQRPPVDVVGQIDRRGRKGQKRLERDRRVRRAQAGVWRDDQDAAGAHRLRWIRRRSEPAGVRELAAEVEAADETEDVAELSAVAGAKLLGERE